MHSVCAGRVDNITLLCVRVFLVKGVLKVLLELLEQKGTTAFQVNQGRVEPGASQEMMAYVVSAASQAILALMVSLALLAPKENR